MMLTLQWYSFVLLFTTSVYFLDHLAVASGERAVKYPEQSQLFQQDATYPHQVRQKAASSVPEERDSNDHEGGKILYSPARGPAIPLAVRSPYTSAWSSTAHNGTLNSNSVMFWDGSPLGWEGIAMVDGIAYEWMGVGSAGLPKLDNLKLAVQRSVAYDSHYSNFTLDAGPVRILASFFSSVLPRELCRTAIPLSYLSVIVRSTDGNTHNVSLYTDVNGAWVTQPAAPLEWDLYKNGTAIGHNRSHSTNALYSWVIRLQTQYQFGESNGQSIAQNNQGVFPQWGNFTFTSSQGSARSMSFQAGFAVDQRFQYIEGGSLVETIDSNFRAYDLREPVFAFEHRLEIVDSIDSPPVVYTIGHVVQPAIKLLTAAGLERLQPWWIRCYGGFFSMIEFHWTDLVQSHLLAAKEEARLRNDVEQYYRKSSSTADECSILSCSLKVGNGANRSMNSQDIGLREGYLYDSANTYGYLKPPNGCNSTGVAIPNVSERDAYYSMVALAARQIMAAYVLTEPSTIAENQSQPLAFQKEISSNGNTNTVDVIFPAMCFFLWSNPGFLRLVLEPLFQNQESKFYPNDYSMHDLGTRFPNATGYVEGDDEYMPLEESANMVIMAYAIYKFTRDQDYLRAHYAILLQWTQHLIENSLIPAVQLSTDDFAGKISNQTNLAIKGIIGIAAMAEISAVTSNTVDAEKLSQIAKDYYEEWEKMAIDPSGHHTLLSYQFRSSWSLLYNVYPAKLLNLSIIPQSLYDMQSAFYPTVSQIWGIPLDSRHDWTKSDWSLWTAAYCKPKTRSLIVKALAYWLNTTSTGYPFPDLFQTNHEGEAPSDPYLIQFLARPVQGGLYSLLALYASDASDIY